MYKAGFALLWLSALCGCSGSNDDDDDDGSCAQRAGTYLAQYTERSGTCGPIPEQLDTIAQQPTEVPPPCTGTISYSADNCTVTSSSICPEDGLGPGWTTTLDLNADWNKSASQGTAIAQFVVKNGVGGIECQSTYNVTITRQ